jgi:hypothetical protein
LQLRRRISLRIQIPLEEADNDTLEENGGNWISIMTVVFLVPNGIGNPEHSTDWT